MGDKLYIVVKGRVAVQVCNPDQFHGTPGVVASMTDGEQFGELFLMSVGEDKDLEKKYRASLRKATCFVSLLDSSSKDN